MDDHVARGAAVRTGVALAAQCNVLVVVDTRGDLDLQRLAGTGLAGAAAGLAGVLDDGAASAAVRAGLLALHHAKRRALLGHDIAAATALGTGLGAGAGRAAVAVAVRAGLLTVQRDLFGAAVGGLLKGQDDVGLNVMALARRVGVGAGRAAEAAKAAAENITEDVAQIDAAGAAEAAKAATVAAAGLAGPIVGIDPSESELVIALALVRVGKNIVGLIDLLELFLGVLVAGVQVGVVLFGQLAVGTFDLGIGGVFADPQHLVVITFFCHRIYPLYLWVVKRLPLEGKLSAERTDEVRPAGYCPQTGNPGSFALIRPCCARPPSPEGGRLYCNLPYNPQGPPPGLPSGGLIMGLLQLRPRGSRRQRHRRPSAAHRHRGRAVHRAAGPVPGRPAGRPSR